MTFPEQLTVLVALLFGVSAVANARNQREVRRRALLEGATVLLRRAGTKWETDIHASIEAENCARVLERLAGAKEPSEIQEKAA
jgi:hypothetical protein